MKQKLFFVLTICFICGAVNAQQITIVEDLQTPQSGQGAISVEASSDIMALLGTSTLSAVKSDSEFITMSGYRIQVFMGNNPRTAKNEVQSKQAQINEKFPELATYVKYDAPNWKLFAGDFLSREEAMVYRQKIQKEFPDFGKELYTVSDKVKILVK